MSTWSGRSMVILRALAGVGEHVTEEHGLPGLYDRIVHLALVELRAERVSLLLWDGTSDQLAIAATAGAPITGSDSLAVPLEGSAAGWVVRRCEALLVDADSMSAP